MLRAIPAPTTEPSSANETAHRLLASSQRRRLNPRRTAGDFDADLEQEISIRRLERRFVEAERAAVRNEARAVPTDPARFANWFESLNATAGQNDALFPWLAELAQRDQLGWFLEQEFAHEAHFADLVALTLVNMPTDETARRHAAQGFRSIPSVVAQQAKPNIDAIVWESLALGNLMVALATARHYAYQSLGALAMVELTAPARQSFVRTGLERVRLGDAGAEQYLSSASFDARHATTWLREVLLSLVTNDPTLAPLIAEGALLRLRAAARCTERYRRELWSAPRLVARFEYADEPSRGAEVEPHSAPASQSSFAPASAFRPVKWREVQRPKRY